MSGFLWLSHMTFSSRLERPSLWAAFSRNGAFWSPTPHPPCALCRPPAHLCSCHRLDGFWPPRCGYCSTCRCRQEGEGLLDGGHAPPPLTAVPAGPPWCPACPPAPSWVPPAPHSSPSSASLLCSAKPSQIQSPPAARRSGPAALARLLVRCSCVVSRRHPCAGHPGTGGTQSQRPGTPPIRAPSHTAPPSVMAWAGVAAPTSGLGPELLSGWGSGPVQRAHGHKKVGPSHFNDYLKIPSSKMFL